MLALSSVDIYLFSPSEHFQIDRVPSILDKIPNKVVLGQTQQSITTMYMINSFKGGPWKQYSHCNGFSEDPITMNALSCFSSRFIVWYNDQWSKNISIEVWMVTIHWIMLLFELNFLRAIFNSANSGWCVCRLCRLSRWVNRALCGAYSWATVCKQVSRATVKRLQCLGNLSLHPG